MSTSRYTRLARYRASKCRMLLSREIKLKGGMRVLEVGAGYGLEALWLASLGVECVALELDSGLCRRIRRRLKKANLHAVVIRGDAQNLPLRDSSFDVACCKAVLHHMPAIHKTLFEMYRVTKKGGVAVAVDEPNALNPFWHIARFLTRCLHLRASFLSSHEFLKASSDEKTVVAFYGWQLRDYFRQARFRLVRSVYIWLPYITYSDLFFKMWLSLEGMVEKTFIPHIFGQLLVVAKK